MEVLKVFWYPGTLEAQAAVAEVEHRISGFLGTRDNGTTAVTPADPSVFSTISVRNTGAFTAGGTYAVQYNEPIVQDFTDGAGHGFLVATDNLFLQASSANLDAAGVVRVKVLYRWKNVSLAEYVGIVQSQQ